MLFSVDQLEQYQAKEQSYQTDKYRVVQWHFATACCSVVLRVLWFLLGFLLGWFLFGGCFSSIAYHIVFINTGIHLASFFPLHILSCFHYQVSLYILGRMLCRSGAGGIKHQRVVPFQGSRQILSMKICSTFHAMCKFTQASKSKLLTYFLLQKMLKH